VSSSPPVDVHAFVTLNVHSSLSSSYTDRVFNDDRSEPASGADTQYAPIVRSSGPLPKHCGTHSTTCSGVPLPAMPAAARPEPKTARPMPASPQNNSSSVIGSVRPVLSPIDACAKKSKEYSPIL